MQRRCNGVDSKSASQILAADYLVFVTDDDDVAEGPPGRPLDSGFRYEPVDRFSELRLGDEAERQILKKIDSVDAARLRAAETSSSTYIG